MKLYRAAMALLVALLSAGPTPSAVADETDYPHCAPYCIEFKAIGDEHFAIAVDANGRFLAWERIQGRAGPILTSARFLPRHPSYDWPLVVSWAACSSRTTTAQYETITHHVTVITTETWCNGELVDVTVTTIRVRKPAEQAPVDN
ncbi:MAG: hypothetical protein OXH15_13905 [Gammaproteobacteria bacterium]|nr:hypothetical protein [Gammaproteobacteria bacterium]